MISMGHCWFPTSSPAGVGGEPRGYNLTALPGLGLDKRSAEAEAHNGYLGDVKVKKKSEMGSFKTGTVDICIYIHVYMCT